MFSYNEFQLSQVVELFLIIYINQNTLLKDLLTINDAFSCNQIMYFLAWYCENGSEFFPPFSPLIVKLQFKLNFKWKTKRVTKVLGFFPTNLKEC